MAIVGEAHIIVRAITTRVKDDIKRGFDGADSQGGRAGERAGNSFKRGFQKSNRGGFFGNLAKEADASYKSISKLITAGYFLGPALAGGVAAISSLVVGLGATIAQAGAAAPALFALVGALSAVMQGAMAVKLAFGGVGAAISAGLQGGGGGGGGSGAADAAEAALKRVEDARRRLAEAIENAAESEERSARTVADAWESYQDSIIDTADAVDALTDAQREAAEMTQQLGFDVEEAALSQERASMSLEEARANLAAVADLPVDSSARREAELAFKEAELNYRRAADRNNDLRQEQEEATAAGSAGADLLVDASRDVADAKEREADSFRSYQDAIVDAERARRDSQRAILEAEEALKDALDDLKKGFGGAAGGADAFAAAMAKLSPEAQEFVRYIISIQDEFKKLRAAAGKELFPRLIPAIDNLVKNLFPMLVPLLEDTGKAMGNVAIEISKTITTADNLGNIRRIFQTNNKVLESFGGTASNLLSIFLDLLDAARPLTEQFAEWTKTLTGGWRGTVDLNKQTGALGETFAYAGEVAEQLGRIFGNVAEAFLDIGKAASGPGSGGEMIFDALEGATDKFKDLVKTISGDGSLDQFFRDSAENTIAIGGAVGKIVGGFLKLGDNKGVANFFTTISEEGGAIESVFDALEELADNDLGTIFGDIANSLGSIFASLTDSGAIRVFMEIISDAARIVADFLTDETVQKVLVFSAGIFAVARAFSFLFTIAKTVFLFIFGAIGRVVSALLVVIDGVGLLATAIGIGTGPLLLIIAAIAAYIGILVGAYSQSEIFREALSDLASTVVDTLIGAWEGLTAAFEDAFSWINLDGVDSIETFKDVLKTLGDVLGTYVVPFIRDVLVDSIKKLVNILKIAIRWMGGMLQGLVSLWAGIYEGIKPYLDELVALWVDHVQPVMDTVVSWFKDTAQPILETVFEKIGEAITSFWNFVSPILRVIGTVIGTVVGVVLVGAFKILLGIIGVVAVSISWLWTTIISPIFNLIVGIITNLVVPTFSLLWQAFLAAVDFMQPVFDLLAGLFRVVAVIIGNVIKIIIGIFNIWLAGWKLIWDSIKLVWNNVGSPLLTGIKDGISTVLSAIGGYWDKFIAQPFSTAWGVVTSVWNDTIWPFLSGLGQKISDLGSSLWSGLETGLDGVIAGIKIGLNALIDVLNFAIDKFNSIPGNPIELDLIPPLATGGVVRPRAGGTIVRVAEAGQAERVEPLDPNGLSVRDKAMIGYLTQGDSGPRSGGGGGVTVNVYPSPGMDERALAARVSRTIAQQMKKGVA